MTDLITRSEYEARNLEMREAIATLDVRMQTRLNDLNDKFDRLNDNLKKEKSDKMRFFTSLVTAFIAGGGFTTILQILQRH